MTIPKFNVPLKWIYASLFAILYIFNFGLQAQPLSFSHLSVENGLSQNSVLAIVQDHRGFMWFGTRNGVNRYDGHSFKTYVNEMTNIGGQSASHITCLLNDSRGTLWAGTRYGLNRYNPEKDDFEHILTGSTINTSAINCLFEDKKGGLWIGTDVGLHYIIPNSSELSDPVYRAAVISLYEDSEGIFWIGTKSGLIKRTLRQNNYTYEALKSLNTDSRLLGNRPITCIAEDDHQNLWAGTPNAGIFLYDRGKGLFFQFACNTPDGRGLIHNNIRKILPDVRGKLWIGTQQGLSLLDPVTKQTISYQYDFQNTQSLSQNSIHSIYSDKSGTIWIGTYFGGVNMTHPFSTDFTVLRNGVPGHSLSNNVVSAITEDKSGHLWIGTEGGGLNFFNRLTGTFTYYQNKPDQPGLSSNLVKSIYLDNEGKLWIGTNAGGVDLLDTHTGRFTYYPKNSSAGGETVTMLKDGNGWLWMGSAGGLSVLRKAKNGSIEKAPAIYKLNNPNVKCLFEDREGNLWIGTANGLHVFNAQNQTRQVFLQDKDGQKGLQADHINCITQDHEGTIWIGTYFGGLSRYNKANNSFTTFMKAAGLPNNNVTGILEDDRGDLWISTANGLSWFNKVQQTFKNYTFNDGLAGNEFNYNSFFKDHEGKLFFGGYNGLTTFFPNRIATNNYQAPVVFTSLKLFNQPVPIHSEDGLLEKSITLTSQIRFRHNQDVFTIDFALLNFIKPGKNKYAYKLEGLNKDWTETNTPSITYTHLPPGDYTLLIKGANNDGIWSQEPARLLITILPPFWKKWWAYLIYILLLATVLFFIIRYFFLKALLKKENDLHQAKLGFFTNISHEIRTHLALITGPLERMQMNSRETTDHKKELNYIKKNSDSLLKLVDELMDFRRVESGHLELHISSSDLVVFVENIYLSFTSLSDLKNITTLFTTTSEQVPLFFDPLQLEKVVFNLLSNAFKFTATGGNINVHIEEKKTTVEIKVTDNGSGISPENLEHLFLNYFQENDYGKQNTGYGIGLALSKSIVELHKGTLTAESALAHEEAANRTCFTVSLLKGSQHFTAQQLRAAASIHSAIPVHYTPVSQEISPGHSRGTNTTEVPEKYTLLIVEDHAEVRSFVRESLAGQYNVVESSNGLAGWEYAVSLIPDLIICDVMMPEMDGITLCGKLKRDERTSHIPLIMLTAKSSTANQVSGLEMGADSYLTKPFSIQVLLLQIRNLLASREKLRLRYSAKLTGVKTISAEQAPETVPSNPIDEVFLQRMVQIVEAHLDDPNLNVDSICKEVAMSRSVLYKKLRAVTDMSVNDFIKAIRLKKAAVMLQQGHLKINEIAYIVGFSDRKYFSKEFKKQFGVTPSAYK